MITDKLTYCADQRTDECTEWQNKIQFAHQCTLENNVGLTLMYWHIGERINREVLGNERAEYGKRIVSAVSTRLQRHLHKGREAACQRWEYSTED